MISPASIKDKARDLGFDLCGIAPADSFPELAFLREWLQRGYAGTMEWMARSADRRADVRQVVPGARSVIVTGTLYNTDRPYSSDLPADVARISRYAWGDDYHEVLKRRLDALLDWIRASLAPSELERFAACGYVDTGPVQERVYAQYAGLGWIGKNTCLINQHLGSWLFLSAIITDLALDPDVPALDHCGRCTLCIDACPTGALVAPYQLDSRRCLSYLTIELKGDIPHGHRDAVGAHAYGCDICQDVCPWNRKAAVSGDGVWQPRPGLDAPRLLDLWGRSDDDLRALLKGSAMKRAGVRRLRRNLAVAIGNSGAGDAAEALEGCGEDTAADPLVRGHIAWAVEKLRG